MNDTWNKVLIWIQENPKEVEFYLFLGLSAFAWIYLALAIKFPRVFAEPSKPFLIQPYMNWTLRRTVGKENYQSLGAILSNFLAFCMGAGFLWAAFNLDKF